MLLQDHFVKSGNILFRWRSFIPLLILAIALNELRYFNYINDSKTLDLYWEYFILSVSFFGLFIRAITVGFTPKGTSGRNTKQQVAETLNTTGIYSVVRNPLYVGNFFMMLGVVLFLHNILLTIVYVLFFWIYYERIISAEENFLKSKFGEEYVKWAEITPAIIPSFKNYKKSDMYFSLKNVLKREYNGFFAVILILFIFEVIGDIVVQKEESIDPFWIITMGVGLSLWLVLKFLKKYTNILDVNGR